MKPTPQHKIFLKPEELLKAAGLAPGMTVADFGCGNGYYSVAAATQVGIKGQIFAIDILEEALSQTATLAKLARVPNVSTMSCDLEKLGSCDLPDTGCDLVILTSILHQTKNRDNVVREAYRVLKTGGKLLVVEWRPDAPFGPETADRVGQDEVDNLLTHFGFRPTKKLPAGSFHYALLYNK